MCPACLTTAALAATGFASASALIALTVKRLRAAARAGGTLEADGRHHAGRNREEGTG